MSQTKERQGNQLLLPNETITMVDSIHQAQPKNANNEHSKESVQI